MPCQDAHGWAEHGGALLAAVADGAGSAAHAEIGAQLAVSTVLRQLQIVSSADDSPAAIRDWLAAALAQTREALLAESVSRGVKLREFACTLLVAVATPGRVVAAQIGDGAVVVFDPAGAPTALTRPQPGGYINETTFLTCESGLAQAQMADWAGPVESLALFTDGLQMLALTLPSFDPFPPFFTPFVKFAGAITDSAAGSDQLATLLKSPRFRERADDDLTLLIARRVGTVVPA
jgi:Protein phosphatase 2C